MLRRRERLAWLGSRGNWVSTATRDGHDRGSTTEAAELAAVETPQAAPPQRHGDGAHAHGIADKQDWTFKRGAHPDQPGAPQRRLRLLSRHDVRELRPAADLQRLSMVRQRAASGTTAPRHIRVSRHCVRGGCMGAIGLQLAACEAEVHMGELQASSP